MYDPELEHTVTLAKSGEAKYSRHEWYQVIKRISNRHRTLGQSPEQAFAKFIQDADGRQLYQAMMKAPNRAGEDDDDSGDQSGTLPKKKKKKPTAGIDGGELTEPMKKLYAMAEEVQKADGGTIPSAMAKVLRRADAVRLLKEDRELRLGI